ncbi:serine/threonine-protein kinase [Dictyobacter aurantiacus]|uniref:non-specific serine/threonine protein kinase n=1 Tax=Dictyobacter aurantiacus TaxID=1936993 RepID=A0A401ZQF3_9CHLR|nr:serine/threonine-protein kinase [Dictyobacter aurantiacus]GCE08986.1 hypothetical protein KDAU_63150 [Dictyobacter aurantiacus]
MDSTQCYCSHCGAANDTDAERCFACDHILKQSELPVEDVDLLHNRYRLLHKSGTGGFGAVYKAQDTHNYDQYVAIKQIMLRGLTAQEIIEATDGFNRELRILSRLSHPHLPRIIDHFTDPENWYLVMDFIEGETLEVYLDIADTRERTRTLPLPEVLDIAMQLCSVLDYLHTRQPPIIFRDLKPGNIMRTPEGKLYMIDFGIARQFKPGQARDTMIFGSPGYAAPEQYGKAQTTPAADIYSLGALLHQMLSGIDPAEHPFHFTPLQLYGAEGMDQLKTLIQLMVDIHAEKRPASIKAVQTEIQIIIDMQQPAAYLKRPMQNINGQIPYYQPSSSANNVAGNGMQQQQQQQSHQPNPVSSKGRRTVMKGLLVLGIVGMTASGAGSYLLDHLFGGPHHIDLSMDGRGPYLPASGNPSDQLSTENALSASHHLQDKGAVNTVRYAPGGRFFASGNIYGAVQVVDSRTATILTRKSISSEAIISLSWSFDGGYLAFSTKTKVYIAQVKTTANTVLLSSPALVYSLHPSPQTNTQTSIYTLAWSPKEHLLAVSDYTSTTHLFQIGEDQTPQLRTLDAGHYPPEPVTKNAGSTLSNQLAWSPDGERIISVSKPGGYSVWQVTDQKIIVDTSFARAVPLQLDWQLDSATPIILITGDAIHLTDIYGNSRYDTLLPDKIIDIAYVQKFDYFIALANGDIYRWFPGSEDPLLVKNGNDTLATLNSIAITQTGSTYSLVAAFSDGMMISYAVPPHTG